TVELRDGTSATDNLPTFSPTAPVLCLADVKPNGSVIKSIADLRTFTTSTKEIVNNVTAAPALGTIAVQTATSGQVTPSTTSTLTGVRGVYVATAGGTTAGTQNA